MNENIAFKARKLKRRGAIHGYFTRDGVVHIKLSEHKAIRILHKNHFCMYILDHEEEEENLFHVSQEVNNSVQSSYWETLFADYFLGWLDCYELFSCWEKHLLYYKNKILKFWSRWSVQKKEKKQTCSKSGCFIFFFFLVWLSVFKIKDRLLNALFLIDNCAIEYFQNVFFMAFFIVTFSLFNNHFLKHNQNLFMKLHY